MAAAKQSERRPTQAGRGQTTQVRRRRPSEASKIKAEIEMLKQKIERELAEVLAQADRLVERTK